MLKAGDQVADPKGDAADVREAEAGEHHEAIGHVVGAIAEASSVVHCETFTVEG
jgi:hypothetical protein